MLATYRREDAVMLICQDNMQRRVEIIALNDNAEGLLGYAKDTLVGKSLSAILPEREANLLSEYVEFEDRGNDAGTVLSRMRDFHLMARSGAEKPFFPKIIPAESQDGRTCFHLLLQPRQSHLPATRLRAAMKEQMGETYPTVQSQWVAEIEAWQQAPEALRVQSCIALLAIDQEQQIIEWHGQKAFAALWEALAASFRQKLRAYDDVILLGGGRLGVMLLDTSPEVVRLVLNRIRWELTSVPTVLPYVGQLSFSFSASYTPMTVSVSADELWKRLHTQLTLSLRDGENHLVAA